MLKVMRSTSMRLALGYAALFIASSLLLVGLLWWNTTGYLDRETDAVIAADTRAVGDRLRDFGLAGAIQTLNERVAADADGKAIYLLADPRLRPLAGNVDAWPLKVGPAPGWYEVELVYRDRLHASRLLHVVLPGNFQLLVGRDVQERVAIRNLFLQNLVWAGLAALGLALLGGWLIRRAVQRRIESINRTALAIVQGDLGRRVPAGAGDDEFDQLVHTINRMLDQIQQLIEGVRNVSNAIAHDLRTPLAETRSRLETLLRRPADQETTLDEIAAAIGDIDRLIGIFNALLRLAEIDSGLRRAGFARVDLAALVADAAELYGPAAEAKGIDFVLETGPGLSVDGDPFLLAQAVGNLLDNAVKYTPADGHIRLGLARLADGGAAITVADSGPGMSREETARATERFYRGDRSRPAAEGVGLGLSLVAAIAKLHGGSLRLEDNEPDQAPRGLRAVLALPAPAC
ncbi:HAMP domain-containing sensor histidine kinase [Ferrovibrio sp.]|uniref:HAMP domain-containing sensor histidine kinase n=1 Tax=Ferrovibrio sp. TaxID=1917215 RepID=UPI0026141471|nr:HAMP domain-containing sensor histidine kinase [Ferrovibrio sp.]